MSEKEKRKREILSNWEASAKPHEKFFLEVVLWLMLWDRTIRCLVLRRTEYLKQVVGRTWKNFLDISIVMLLEGFFVASIATFFPITGQAFFRVTTAAVVILIMLILLSLFTKQFPRKDYLLLVFVLMTLTVLGLSGVLAVPGISQLRFVAIVAFASHLFVQFINLISALIITNWNYWAAKT